MSVVSGVTLQISCAEDYTEREGAPDTVSLIDKVNAWLAEQTFGPLVAVEGRYGGNKHPQVLVYGAGYNAFFEDEFGTFVMSLPWNVPESVVLLIQPEDGPTKVFRPASTS